MARKLVHYLRKIAVARSCLHRAYSRHVFFSARVRRTPGVIINHRERSQTGRKARLFFDCVFSIVVQRNARSVHRSRLQIHRESYALDRVADRAHRTPRAETEHPRSRRLFAEEGVGGFSLFFFLVVCYTDRRAPDCETRVRTTGSRRARASVDYRLAGARGAPVRRASRERLSRGFPPSRLAPRIDPRRFRSARDVRLA
jgi:hypothetical protein